MSPGQTSSFTKNFYVMKKLLLISVISMLFYISCDDRNPYGPWHEGANHKPLKKYSGDLAVKWMNLQMTISRTTPGFNPSMAIRAFAYSGLSLYESVVEGMPGYKSVASSMIGIKVPPHNSSFIFFPASANAAMASIIKNLIPTASAVSIAKIDSLEAAFNSQFSNEAPANQLKSLLNTEEKLPKLFLTGPKQMALPKRRQRTVHT